MLNRVSQLSPPKMPAVYCPACKQGIGGFYLYPMSFRDLEKAGALRRRNTGINSVNEEKSIKGLGFGNSRKRRNDFITTEVGAVEELEAAASPFLFLSDTRTGRWTSEEICFVDHLIRLFDNGALTLPHGVKLNDFLSEILMCKSSRLTKKMKNARLSTRSYSLGSTEKSSLCCSTLSRVQEVFLKSHSSEAVQLELRFNITRLWRTHFSNLCLQVGFESLLSDDWLSSLEEMERRTSAAEEAIRMANSKRMKKALERDSNQEGLDGVFIAGKMDCNMVRKNFNGFQNERPCLDTQRQSLESSKTKEVSTVTDKVPEVAKSDMYKDDADFLDAIDGLIDVPGSIPARNRISSEDLSFRPRLQSDDFSFSFLDTDPDLFKSHFIDINSADKSSIARGPFLAQIIDFLEEEQLPFHHVDIWVPSYVPGDLTQSKPASLNVTAQKDGGSQTNLILFHAGDATRTDLSSPLASYQLKEFGKYSQNFSFAPGAGMPGRVYVSAIPSWENSIQNADPEHFKRSSGAKMCGIKTVLGIPVNSSSIGSIVVALYSTLDVPRDVEIVRKCFMEFQKYDPEPKWNLVIDLPSSTSQRCSTSNDGVPSITDVPSHFGGVILPRPTEMSVSGNIDGREASARVKSSNCILINHDHGALKGKMSTNLEGAKDEDNNENEKNEIANLLAEHVPMIQSDSLGNVTSSAVNDEVLSGFVSLRLLLLQSPGRCSEQDNDIIGIIKKSYRGYSAVKRNSNEIALLLVKDWIFLRSSMGTNNGSVQQIERTTMSHINYKENRQQPLKRSSALPFTPDFQQMRNLDYKPLVAQSNDLKFDDRYVSSSSSSSTTSNISATYEAISKGLARSRAVSSASSMEESSSSKRKKNAAAIISDN